MATFPAVSEQVAGHWQWFRQITCACGFVSRLSEKRPNLMPDAVIATRFRQKGWRVGPPHACPRCAEGRTKRPLSRAQKRAIWCKLNGVDKAVNENATTLEEQPVTTAEAPKQPTPADRRRVNDALEEHYLADKGCYSKAWSDKALAAKLAVPEAWVRELRELMFGPGDGNEAHAAEAEAIARFESDFTALSNDVLAKLDELERRFRQLKVDRNHAA